MDFVEQKREIDWLCCWEVPAITEENFDDTYVKINNKTDWACYKTQEHVFCRVEE